jgi:hypothetical protein
MTMISGDLVSTGIVELKHDGFIRRGQYSTNGATLTVTYGRRRKTAPLGPVPAHNMARAMLRELVMEMQALV